LVKSQLERTFFSIIKKLKQNILILGGTGFVGRHLSEALSEDFNVTLTTRTAASLANMKSALKQGDIRSIEFLEDCMEEIDLVIHLVSASVPASSNGNEFLDIENNLLPSIQLLKVMERKKVKKLIFLSSGGAIYGNQPQMPITEQNSLNPISTYGIIKATIEHFIALYNNQFGIDFLILRAANLYGPRQSHSGLNGVINTLMDRIIEGKPIEIWGDGTQEKDYLYISDLINAIQLGISQEVTGTYNIGSNTGTSLNEVIAKIERISGKNITATRQSARPFDVQRFILDYSSFHHKTGWKPLVTLEQGLQKLWEHKIKS
jgi:UDP-glucose 4-epimerase